MPYAGVLVFGWLAFGVVIFTTLLGYQFFTTDTRLFLDFDGEPRAASEFKKLSKRTIIPMRPLTMTLVETLGYEDEVREMLHGPWERLLTFSEPTYEQLTLEFFSTFQFDELHCTDLHSTTHGPRYRLGGEWHQPSVVQFGVELDLFHDDEIEVFTVSGRRHLTTAEEVEFWDSVTVNGTGAYNPRRSKATSLRNPLHRLLHRAMVGTVTHRGDSSHGGFPRRDLLYLFSIVRQVPVNLAFNMAAYFASSHRTSSSPICGGGFVTRLARNLGVLTPDVLPRLKRLKDVNALDIRALQKMSLVVFTAGGYRLLDGNQQLWVPDADEDEDEDAAPADAPAGNSPVRERVMTPPAPPSPPPEPSYGGYHGGRHSTSGYSMPEFQNLHIERPLPQSSYNPYMGNADSYSTMDHIRQTVDRSWDAIQGMRGDIQTVRGDTQYMREQHLSLREDIQSLRHDQNLLREEQLRQREYYEQAQRNYEEQHSWQLREADWLYDMGTDILARFGYPPPPHHNLRDPQPGQRRQRND